MKKVCFVQHASEWPLFEKIAKAFKEQGIESVFVCKTRSVFEKYCDLGFNSVFISDIFNQIDQITLEELAELDKKYGPPSISEIGDSDVQLADSFGHNLEQKHRVIGLAYKFWEKFFEKNKIDYVIVRETATFSTRTVYNFCKKNNIPLAQFAIGPGDRFVTLDNVGESHVWSELLDVLKKGFKELNTDQKKVVQDFIDERLSSIKEKMTLRFVPPPLMTTLKNFFGMFFHDNKSNWLLDPIKVAALRHGRKRLYKKIVWKYITKNFFRYSEPDSNDKYVYFPMYSGEETSYLVNTHYWARNEKSLIKETANNLPQGYVLYVKEHPTNPGDLTFSELRELSKIKNIKILRPTVDATELILNSEAVCVLLGTTGWEAFLAKIPVIVIGNTFFSYSRLVYSVQSMSYFSELFWEVLEQGKDVYKKNEAEWEWFIHAVITSCGKGESVKLVPPYGFPTDEDNARKIAEFIHSTMLKRGV
ncbi:hypothetical protein H6775_01735 [Candidatus Nomurabacteria bacterium]|nr:hypothetical protein [Candidatus Nomurabacteria bacterium]